MENIINLFLLRAPTTKTQQKEQNKTKNDMKNYETPQKTASKWLHFKIVQQVHGFGSRPLSAALTYVIAVSPPCLSPDYSLRPRQEKDNFPDQRWVWSQGSGLRLPAATRRSPALLHQDGQPGDRTHPAQQRHMRFYVLWYLPETKRIYWRRPAHNRD